MKLLRNETKEKYQEIEVEFSFLLIKRKVIYRKDLKTGSIVRFKKPDFYYEIGLSEYCQVREIFYFNP